MNSLGKKELGLNTGVGESKELLNLGPISEWNQLKFGDCFAIKDVDHEFVKLCLCLQE